MADTTLGHASWDAIAKPSGRYEAEVREKFGRVPSLFPQAIKIISRATVGHYSDHSLRSSDWGNQITGCRGALASKYPATVLTSPAMETPTRKPRPLLLQVFR